MMEFINQAQYLLTLPKSLFKRIMDSAYAHNRHPMDEFVYRLYQSFEVEGDGELGKPTSMPQTLQRDDLMS